MSIHPYTQARDAVASALAQMDAAWRLRQENPKLLRQALDNFHAASAAFAKAVEQQEEDAASRH
jgi:hypothetical protein